MIKYLQSSRQLTDEQVAQQTGIDVDRYKVLRDIGSSDIELWEIVSLEDVFQGRIIKIL